MSSQPGPDVPPEIGPFRLRSRLAEHSAGVVHLAQDASGREVAVAVLHAAAGSDPAVRDRLAVAVRELSADAPDQLLGADPRGEPPWVATAYDGGDPTRALGLLDAAALVAPTGTPSGAPDFQPHWTSPSAGATPAATAYTPPGASAGTAASTPKALLLVVALVFVGVLAVGAAGWFAWTAFSSGSDTGGGVVAEDEPAPEPPQPAPEREQPEESEREAEEVVPDGPPGPVAGPTYGEGEGTYLMDDIFGFDFRAPDGWGCIGRSDPSPNSTGVTCVDEGGTFPPKEDGAGGIIEVTPCPAPCGEKEWKRIREFFPDPETPWREIDESTLYAQTDVIETEEGPMVGLRMSHVYAASGDGQPDHHLTVRTSGPPEDLKAMQKLVNELRDRTP